MRNLFILLIILLVFIFTFCTKDKVDVQQPTAEFIVKKDGFNIFSETGIQNTCVYVGDVLVFDASESLNSVEYRWDWDCVQWNDWDIITTNNISTHIFQEGEYMIRLETVNKSGWTNISENPINVTKKP